MTLIDHERWQIFLTHDARSDPRWQKMRPYNEIELTYRADTVTDEIRTDRRQYEIIFPNFS